MARANLIDGKLKSDGIVNNNLILSWLISVSGIAFWFVIDFPFSHSYESFYWMKEYYSSDLFNFIFQPVGHYLTYRPLGQLVCSLLFEISDGGLFLIQLFNFTMTVSSILIIVKSSIERDVISLLFMLIGGLIFSVFTYLFHLNGLFYSGVIFLLGVLLYYDKVPLSQKSLFISFLISIAASLFNPFALFVYIFFLTGICIEKRNIISKRLKKLIIFLILIELAFSFLLVPHQFQYLNISNIVELRKIYSGAEANAIIKLLILLLLIIAVLSLSFTKKVKICFIVFSISASVLFYKFSIPLIFILLLISFVKLIRMGRITLLFLLIVTFFFTFFTGTQPSHMKVFLYLLIPVIVGLNIQPKFISSFFNSRVQLSLIIGVIVLITLVKSGINIPKLSRFTSAMLSKKEQTYQLEKFIEWYKLSEYKCYKIETESTGSINGVIPVSAEDLNAYLQVVNDCPEQKGGVIILSTSKISGQYPELIWVNKGIYAPDFYVYLKKK